MTAKQRLNVHLYVIPTCNLKCIHCYSEAMPLGTKIDQLLSIEDMRSVIVNLCNYYDAAFDVEGGEFFLRKDIGQLFEVVPEEYWHNITITTNGITKIQMNLAYLRSLDEFRVSVEGHTDELQNNIRGIHLTPVLRNCRGLMENGVPVTLRITLHKQNYDRVLEMLHYFIALGFTRFSLYEFQSTGRGASVSNDYELGVPEIKTVLRQLSQERLADKTDVFKLSLSSRRISLVHSFRQELETKGYQVKDISGIASLTVNYNGILGVCPWNVVNENAGSLQRDTFINNVNEMMNSGKLHHTCTHCSAIRIQRRMEQ